MPGKTGHRKIVFGVIGVAVILAAAFVLFPRVKSDPSRPNIIVVLVDTLRRDHVGIYGYPRLTTPALDDLAGRNVLFTDAYPNSNWTKPSVASLFTGLYVGQHGVKYILTRAADEAPAAQALPEEAVSLAEVLAEAGYRTLGVVENVHVSKKLGFSQGFETWKEDIYGATNVTNTFLRSIEGVETPFFAYIHYFDPHIPYYRNRIFEGEGEVAPGLLESKASDIDWGLYAFAVDTGFVGLSGLERQRLVDLYDGEIRDVDIGLARIFAALREKGLFENSWIIVTADHGENFYETGRMAHPHDCFSNPQIRVPLVMKLPSALGLSEITVTQPVMLVDIMPTVLGHLGLGRPGGLAGVDLMGAIRSQEALPARAIIAESESGGMILSSWEKLVEVKTRVGHFRFLHDLRDDPLERIDIHASAPERAEEMAAQFQRTNAAARAELAVEATTGVTTTAEELERLKGLGYFH